MRTEVIGDKFVEILERYIWNTSREIQKSLIGKKEKERLKP